MQQLASPPRPRWAGLLLPLLLGLMACNDTPLEKVMPDGGPPSTSQQTQTPPSLQAPTRTKIRRIALTEKQRDELNIQTTIVRRQFVGYMLSLPGEVQPAPDHVAQVSAPIGGRVAQIYAHEGEAVRQGQVVLELESLEFANLVADYLQAQAEETYAQRQVDRLTMLVQKKISPQSALDKAQADLDRADASTKATYARLKALGVDADQLQRWMAEQQERPLLPITAPISGTIDQHQIELGQSVTAYQEMLTVVNPGKVLIKGYVSPDDAAALTPGDSVTVTPENSSLYPLEARVTTVNPAVDPESKSVTVNILTPTRNHRPMPGQTVQLKIRVRSPEAVVTIPPSAVVYDGNQPVVFVQNAPLTYERRPITIERTGDEEIIVASGLQEEEAVATSQVFSLKALDRYSQYAE